MKIGILTFVDTINYGALFQAYALEMVLNDMGHDAYVIQYKNDAIEKREKNANMLSLRGILSFIVIGNKFKEKEKKFKAFELENVKRTEICNAGNIADICGQFDKIVTGSDQVWNVSLTDNDMHYFLDFVEESSKKISYAPSFGEGTVPSALAGQIGNLLKGFHAISVREESGASIVLSLSGEKATVVIDPTLLLPQGVWMKFVGSRICKEPYILVYLPHKKDICFSFAKKLKAKTGLKIIYLSISPRIITGVKTIYDASPQEWLSWIYYAEYVVTGSFHGMAFSLNFGKNFFFEPQGAGSRVDCLAKMTGTEDRNLEIAETSATINYGFVGGLLSEVRQLSLLWLKTAIEK